MGHALKSILVNDDLVLIYLQCFQSFVTLKCSTRYFLQPAIDEIESSCVPLTQRHLGNIPKICMQNEQNLWSGTVQEGGVRVK